MIADHSFVTTESWVYLDVGLGYVNSGGPEMTMHIAKLKNWYSTRSRVGILLFGFAMGLGFSNVIAHDLIFIVGVCITAVSGMLLGFWSR